MKNIIFIMMALLMVSCETLTGQLTVSEDLTFRDGTAVSAGTYKATVKAKRRSLTLGLPSEVSVKFKIPKGTDLPSRNGNISLSSADLKQPYDIQGRMKTETTNSDSRRDYERCSYQRPYTVCQTDRRGRTTCYTRYQTVYGYRDVQYRVRTDHKYLSVSLLSPGTNVSNGQFEGEDISKYRVYEWTNVCR
jgi:hypothetical protein